MYSASGKMLTPRAQAYYARKNAKKVAIVPVMKKTYRKYPKTKVEYKVIDTAGSYVCDTTGAVTLLNGCVQGDDIANREGRQINVRSMEIKMLNTATAATGVDQLQRVLIVLDKQANGATPAITDILTANNINAPRNLNNSKRFKILVDKRMQLNAAGESGSTRLWKKYKKMYIPVQYNNGNAGTSADITTNALYMVSLGNIAAGVTAGIVQGYCRLRFTE